MRAFQAFELVSAPHPDATARSRPIADVRSGRSLALMHCPKWISFWHGGCLLAGLMSSALAGLWLWSGFYLQLTMDSIGLVFLAMAFVPPAMFAIAWPKRPMAQRAIGIAAGVAGAGIGIYLLIGLWSLSHT